MANLEQLAILKQGIVDWNEWRRHYPGIKPDLSAADLTRMDLTSANLMEANLRETDLRWADLKDVDFTSADLSHANLMSANLFLADFALADLRWARLVNANCSGTNLFGAKLAKATVGFTTFANVDFSNGEGLDEVLHVGPSSIGIDTLYRSQGNIPKYFLRQAGVPESFVAYLDSLLANAIEFYSCFVSYSSQDQLFAERLHADLQNNSVRCWFAPHDLRTGDRFRDRIDESIRLHDKLLLILSDNSIRSGWVRTEVEA